MIEKQLLPRKRRTYKASDATDVVPEHEILAEASCYAAKHVPRYLVLLLVLPRNIIHRSLVTPIRARSWYQAEQHLKHDKAYGHSLCDITDCREPSLRYRV